MRILFMPQAGSLGIGGITRCLSVAYEALQQGNKVAFFGRLEISKFLKGLPINLFEAPVPPSPNLGRSGNFRLADSILIRNMDNYDYLKKTVRSEIKAIRTFNPTAIFTENQFSSTISAEATSVPLVSTVASVNLKDFKSSLYPENQSAQNVELNFNRIASQYGIKPYKNISELSFGRSSLNIAPTIPEFEPDLITVPNIFYCGSLLYPQIEIGKIPDEIQGIKEIIYVYLSVGKLLPTSYIPILSRLAEQIKYPIVIVVRNMSIQQITKFRKRNKNLFIYRFLPGSTIASLSRLQITRGGQNSMMSSLIAGIPSLGFPCDSAEAHFNMEQMVKFDLGTLAKEEDFNVNYLASKISEMVQDTQKYNACNNFRKKIIQLGGARDVLQRIHNL